MGYNLSKLFQYPLNIFIVVPFLYWIGEIFSAVYVVILAACAIIARMMRVDGAFCLKPISVYVGIFSVVYITVALLLYEGGMSGLLAFESHSQTFLMMLAVQFFLLVVIINLVGNIDNNDVTIYIKYVYYVFLISILLESLLTNLFHVPISFFPGYKESFYYNQPVTGNYYRPFGLIGSAPMNGSALVVFMWFYLSLAKKTGRDALVIYALTFATLIVNFSGQAMLTFLATILLFHMRANLKNIMIFIVLVLLIHCTLYYEWLGWKLSYPYIMRMMEYLNISEIMGELSMRDYLFGAMSNKTSLNFITMEFYPLFSISRFGFILTLFLWGLILFQKCNRPMKMGLYAVIIGSLHYGTLLAIVLQVPLAIVLLNMKNQPGPAHSFDYKLERGERMHI